MTTKCSFCEGVKPTPFKVTVGIRTQLYKYPHTCSDCNFSLIWLANYLNLGVTSVRRSGDDVRPGTVDQ